MRKMHSIQESYILIPMMKNIVLFSAVVLAHSWVEDLSVVSKDWLQLGKSGYARGNGKLVETGVLPCLPENSPALISSL